MPTAKLFSFNQAKRILPRRSNLDSKTRGGKCLVIAGSPNMLGASILSATAAARIGAGYVYLISESSHFDFQKNPDFLYLGSLHKEFTKLDLLQFSSIAIGPGMTNKLWISKILRYLYKINFSNVVIDATALQVIARKKLKLRNSWILTPHEGELAKLLSMTSTKVKAHRLEAVKLAQKKFNCLVLLKGKNTLIATDKNIFKVTSGNSALAKAGTGDVLTGMIAGLLSQKLNPLQATCLGSFAHGLCANFWTKSGKDHLSLLASDLLTAIPKILHLIRKHRAT